MSTLETHWLTRTIGRSVRRVAEIGFMPINAVMTLCIRTDKKRWSKVARQEPSWDERNRLIGALIPDNSSIVDLGSGAMTLKRYLKPGCQYQPCDVVRSSAEVIVCDFNAEIFPDLPRRYDYVVCSGILEYMRDPEDFLARLPAFGARILLSYNPIARGETRLSRLGKGWVNHFGQNELEELFGKVGLTFRVVLRREPNEVTYELIPESVGKEQSSILRT